MRKGTVQPNGKVVKKLREERGWTQEDLAGNAGFEKKTIENIEQGNPVFVHTLANVAAALGRGVEVRDLLFSDEPIKLKKESTRSTGPGTAPSMPTLLVGREPDLALLVSRLTRPPQKGAQRSTQIITTVRGWPGVGKTALARALAHSPLISKAFPDGVLWTSLGQHPLILTQLIEWGRALGDEAVMSAVSVNEASQRLAALLRRMKMLLVIDDVWEAEHFRPFAIGGAGCATLATTRLISVADSLSPTPDEIYRLDVLTDDLALELLEKLAPNVVDGNRKACRELVKALEGLPLALQVAGRLLRAEKRIGSDVGSFVQELITDSAKLLSAKVPFDMTTGEVSPTVTALLNKSTDYLKPDIRKRYTFLAPFAPRPATFELSDLAAVWKVDEQAARETVNELVDRGLLEPLGDSEFQIHQVLVEHAKSLLKQK